MSRLCDFYETRHTDRSLHADQKSPCPQSHRTNPLTYRGHRRSHYRDMGRTLWENCPRAISMKIGILIHVCMLIKSLQPIDLQRSPKVLITMTNMTYGDPCRSSGGSYDFGAI